MSDRSLRLLLVATDFPPAHGGIQEWTVQIARQLGSRHAVTVIAPRQPGCDAYDRTLPCRVVRVRAGRGRLALLAALTLATTREATMRRPHLIVFCHVFAAIAGAPLCAALRLPYLCVAYGRELHAGRAQPFLRAVLNAGQGCIAISEHTARLLAARGVRPGAMHVIPPGIDETLLTVATPADALPAALHGVPGPMLLTVSRLDGRYKGHDMLLQALPQVLERVPDAVAVICGEGRLRAEYEQLATSLGIRDHVVFTGSVSGDARLALYDRCDVFALLSREEAAGDVEGFGIVFLEAAARGKPTIGGNSGGIPDAIADGVSGVLVDPTDVAAIAERCAQLLLDRDLARRLGEAGRERVRRRFTWTRIGRQIEEVARRAATPRYRRERRAPRRILFYNHAPEISGAERSLLALVAHARDAGYAVALAAPAGPLLDAGTQIGVSTIATAPVTIGYARTPLAFVRYLARATAPALDLARVVRRPRPDLVHANSIRSGLIAAVALALVPRRPRLVVHLRDAVGSGALGRLIAFFLVWRAQALIAISRYVARGIRPDRGKVHVIHNAVDPARYRSDPAGGLALRRALGIAADAPLLAVVGQITPWKGQLDALEAFALIRRSCPDARLLIAGTARFTGKHRRYDTVAYERQLHARADRPDLAGAVHFPGEIADAADIYAAATLLLVPSWDEPFGRVVIEAMAAGCPVLATRAGGIPEIIAHDENGWLVPPHDPAALAQAALQLLADPERRARLSRHGHATVVAHFSLATYLARIERIWGVPAPDGSVTAGAAAEHERTPARAHGRDE